jgi:hypothetical protein
MSIEKNNVSVTYCFNCKAEISLQDKFCQECGVSLGNKISTSEGNSNKINNPPDSIFLITILYVFAFFSIIGGFIIVVSYEDKVFGYIAFFIAFVDFILFISIAKILSKIDFLLRRIQ